MFEPISEIKNYYTYLYYTYLVKIENYCADYRESIWNAIRDPVRMENRIKYNLLDAVWDIR